MTPSFAAPPGGKNALERRLERIRAVRAEVYRWRAARRKPLFAVGPPEPPDECGSGWKQQCVHCGWTVSKNHWLAPTFRTVPVGNGACVMECYECARQWDEAYGDAG